MFIVAKIDSIVRSSVAFRRRQMSARSELLSKREVRDSSCEDLCKLLETERLINTCKQGSRNKKTLDQRSSQLQINSLSKDQQIRKRVQEQRQLATAGTQDVCLPVIHDLHDMCRQTKVMIRISVRYGDRNG
jgi:hypothetical protein